MNNDNKPATPSNEAAPGKEEQATTPSPAATPEKGKEEQKTEEGQVTISAKEYRDLQRAKARASAAQKRMDLSKRSTTPNDDEEGDQGPDRVEVARLQAELESAERARVAAEVRVGVSDILARDEFKDIPASVKRMIQKNPSAFMSTKSNSVEEGLLDIEDYLNEEVASPSGNEIKVERRVEAPSGHETPPNIGGGGAGSGDQSKLEDLNNLSGSERSRAAFRNILKKGGTPAKT